MVFTQRIHHIAFHFFAHRLKHCGVCNDQCRRLLFHHYLSLLIQLGALFRISRGTCRLNDVFKGLITPFRVVRTLLFSRTAEECGEEVIRIPVVTGPAHHDSLRLARFCALEVLAPLIGHNLGFHADFRPVCLDHLSHTAGVRVIRTLNRHRPQVDFKAVFHTCFFQQRFGFFRIIRIVFNAVVVAPHGRRDQVFRFLACALIHRVNDGIFINCHIQCLTYFDVIQRFFRDVIGEIADVQARLLFQDNVFIFTHTLQVCRVRVRHYLTLVFLQFGVTDRGIRGDGEDQAVNFRFAVPVIVIGFIQDTGIFLVLLQHKRPGADRVQVDFLRCTGFQHLIGIFSGKNGGEVHPEVCQERRFRAAQLKTDSVVIDLLNFIDDFIHIHAAEIFITTAGDLVIRVIRVFLAVEGKDHIIRIEITGWFEILAAVEFHPFAQMERIGFSVFAHIPGFRQARLQLCGTGFKLHQPVIQRHGAGIISGSRSEQLRVKPFR